jgi:hypothetical protein
MVNDSRQNLIDKVNLLRKHSPYPLRYNPETGNVEASVNNRVIPIEPGFLKSITADKWSVIGAVVFPLAAAPVATAAAVGGTIGTFGLVTGLATASAAGGGLGAGVDMLVNAIKLNHDVETMDVMDRIGASGLSELALTAFVGGLLKVGTLSLKGIHHLRCSI